MVEQGSPDLPVLRDTRDATAVFVMQGKAMAASRRKGFSQLIAVGIEGRIVMADPGRFAGCVDLCPERAGSCRRRQT
jgi:hypothetical protein